LKCAFKSQQIDGVIDPIKEVIAIARQKSSALKIDLCCISAAGPVEKNYCQMTNCKWAIDGEAIKKSVKVDTLVINDFLAVGYGIPTLAVDDPKQITRLPTTDGKFPAPAGSTKIVVGAGTGLGVGFLTNDDGKYRAHPSEGGHSGFAAFDEETIKLKEYVAKKLAWPPEPNRLSPVRALPTSINYLKDGKKLVMDGVLKEIDQAKDEDKPALISRMPRTTRPAGTS
jgi:glucokinase